MRIIYAIIIYGLGLNAILPFDRNTVITNSLIILKDVLNSDESFKTFFDRFNAEPAFQKSRVTLPLKLVNTSDNGNENKTTHLQTWKYYNFKKHSKGIIHITQIDKGNIRFRYQIEDTGISVTYYFRLEKGMWWLVSVKDESD